jgi:signal transduction histidine kinase
MWLFSVADNGIGIPIELRGRAFRMFQRLHTRNQYPGEGIGLTVCKGIVEHYGGTMWLDGNPGGGTIVLFTLHPAVQEAGGVDRDTHQQTA